MIVPGTLRAELEARRAAGRRFSLAEAAEVLLPVCAELAALHAGDARLFVHPSALSMAGASARLSDEPPGPVPALPHDRACLAPEIASGGPGDARASVFAIGAVLYELVTGAAVGPGMKRPSELVPGLPPSFEAILAKALIGDPKQRPADLGALAQAMQGLVSGAPSRSHQPSLFDIDVDLEVDVSTSLMPPAGPPAPGPRASQGSPYAVAVAPNPVPSLGGADDPTTRLAVLKARLEADTRPRYLVAKDGMDHGPFSAVELLQQIASGSFTGDHVLKDTVVQQERAIKDWEQFASFAEQAKLNRDIVQEKKALEAVVVAERKGTQYKALVGAALIGVIAAGGAGWWLREKKSKERALQVKSDDAVMVQVDGGLASSKKAGAGAGRVGGGGGTFPVLGGGMSCEGARAKYVEEYKMGGSGTAPDLTAGAYAGVLNKGTYLNACGVPSSSSVTVCAAVQNGRAVGVTVSLNPPDRSISSCVAGQIRSMSFPSHPRLDVATTTFAGQ